MFRIPSEEIKSSEQIHADHVYVMLNDNARDIVLKRIENGSELVFLNTMGERLSLDNIVLRIESKDETSAEIS